MRWMPCVIASRDRSDELAGVRVGHPLVDEYLEFARSRARPNTIRAVAFDLKVFFSVGRQDPGPGDVGGCDVVHRSAAQRSGDRRWCRSTGSSGLSPRTIRRRLSSVSGFYAYLMVRDDTSVTRNPVPTRFGDSS